MRIIGLVGMLLLIVGAKPILADELESLDETSQTAETLRPASGEVFMNIGEVVVQDRNDATRNIDLPVTIDVLGADEIKYENLDNSLELLRKLPGITIGDYGNGGVPNGFTLRGYDSNSHGNHTVVTIHKGGDGTTQGCHRHPFASRGCLFCDPEKTSLPYSNFSSRRRLMIAVVDRLRSMV